jgi:hypothetical protein
MLAVHLLAACLALAVGIAAIRVRASRRTHRRLGLAYVACWAVIGTTGWVLGARRPGLSVFEVLNLIGVVLVVAGWSIPALAPVRRRLGAGWRGPHLRLMLGSLAFPVIAGVNQLLGGAARALDVPYPMWAFYLLVAAPFVVLPRVGRRLAAARPAPPSPTAPAPRDETRVPAAA